MFGKKKNDLERIIKESNVKMTQEEIEAEKNGPKNKNIIEETIGYNPFEEDGILKGFNSDLTPFALKYIDQKDKERLEKMKKIFIQHQKNLSEINIRYKNQFEKYNFFLGKNKIFDMDIPIDGKFVAKFLFAVRNSKLECVKSSHFCSDLIIIQDAMTREQLAIMFNNMLKDTKTVNEIMSVYESYLAEEKKEDKLFQKALETQLQI